MEGLKLAMEQHINQMDEFLDKFSIEFRSGFKPAVDNFIGFFHAIDWKEPWLIALLSFHAVLLLVIAATRKHTNFQMVLFLFTLGGVYGAERLNRILGSNWREFAGQNYFDRNGVFFSVLWSGPLLLFSVLILVNTLLAVLRLMVRWKRAELRHRVSSSRRKCD